MRRTNTLSDASTVLVLDTADDLSERVDLWGASTPHPAQTSLDIARTAALSLAEAVCGAGDRVSLIELALHGRVVRSGTGRRQAARIANALSMISQREDSVRLLRMPPFPHGSTVYLLSTFFDGDAARLALDWSASGHRVIGVDTLPPPVLDELTEPQRIAYRLVAAERAETLRDMAGAGVTIVNWPQASAQLRAMSMVHR